MAIASDSSLMPTAARWRVPSVPPIGASVRGRTQAAARMRLPRMITAPSCRGVFGVKIWISVCRVRIAVLGHAAIGVILQARFALDDDQRADPLPRELQNGADDLVNRLADLLLGAGEGEIEPGARLAELLEGAAQFRLEDHRHGDDEGREGDLQQAAERGERELLDRTAITPRRMAIPLSSGIARVPRATVSSQKKIDRHDEDIEQRERCQAREYPRQFEGDQ